LSLRFRSIRKKLGNSACNSSSLSQVASSSIWWLHCTCQYPADWVPPRTSSELRQEAGHVSMHCHVSHSTGLGYPIRERSSGAMRFTAPDPLSTQEGSGAATHPVAPDPASLLGRALELPHVSRPRIPLPAQEGSGATMLPASLCGL
jgi:hypothetical protein